MGEWEATEGAPQPLGAVWLEDEQTYNFALYSRHARGVELLLYVPDDLVNPVATREMAYLRNKTGWVWHCRMGREEAREAHYYAYRVTGPADPKSFELRHFNSHKVLLDPYAEAVVFPAGFDRTAAMDKGANDGRAPLGCLRGAEDQHAWMGDRPVRSHEADLIIYEMHVGQFTRNPNSGVEADNRGTFAGLVEKIDYLKQARGHGRRADADLPVQTPSRATSGATCPCASLPPIAATRRSRAALAPRISSGTW